MKINLILLASGFSRRFNGNKLFAELNEKPLYMHIVDKIIELNCEEEKPDLYFNKIICVTQYEEIEKRLKDTKIQVVRNYNSDLGISNSIKLGINYDTEADGYMFMVCDQPFIKKETIIRMIEVFSYGKKGIAAVGRKETTADGEKDILGNPVIFSRKYIDELSALEGDKGGKKVVMKHMNDVEIIEAEDKIELADIDTQEVYELFKNNHMKHSYGTVSCN